MATIAVGSVPACTPSASAPATRGAARASRAGRIGFATRRARASSKGPSTPAVVVWFLPRDHRVPGSVETRLRQLKRPIWRPARGVSHPAGYPTLLGGAGDRRGGAAAYRRACRPSREHRCGPVAPASSDRESKRKRDTDDATRVFFHVHCADALCSGLRSGRWTRGRREQRAVSGRPHGGGT